MASKDRKKPHVDADFPQWNSKLSYSAQKPHAGAPDHQSTKVPGRRTPLGQPRRVPVAAGKTATAQNAKGVVSSTPTRQTPGDSDKTPTICLFQRFESLTINTPVVTAGKAVAASGGDPAGDDDGSKPRRSVAFGTPSVLTYTPAAVPAAAQASPLWSNAGHTPYSLSGATAPGCIVECEDSIHNSGSSGVCMELFSSVITDTGAEQTPSVRTIPRTPVLGSAAAPAVADTAAASLMATAASGVTPRLTGVASSPDAADTDDMDLQTPATKQLQTIRQPSAASGPSFSGFNTVQECLDIGHLKDRTPPFFGKAVAQHAAEGSTPALVNAAEGATPAAADGLGSFCMPAVTPKSKLKQPARVQVRSCRPAVPSELKQLLGEHAGDKTASTASTNKSLLGSCGMLSPVRPKKQQQESLGAEQQVLTPVRRSARKSSKQLLATDTEHVKPMLEATNYCYQPNEALQDLQHQG